MTRLENRTELAIGQETFYELVKSDLTKADGQLNAVYLQSGDKIAAEKTAAGYTLSIVRNEKRIRAGFTEDIVKKLRSLYLDFGWSFMALSKQDVLSDEITETIL